MDHIDDECIDEDVLDATLSAADVLLRVVARTVIAVEDLVTGPQLRVLVLIFRDGPMIPSAVAAELSIHASNATRVCSRLARAGLIKLLPPGSDRRLRTFDLTAKGRRLVTGVMKDRRAAIADVVGRLTASERKQVASALEIFARSAHDVPRADRGLTIAASALTGVRPRQK